MDSSDNQSAERPQRTRPITAPRRGGVLFWFEIVVLIILIVNVISFALAGRWGWVIFAAIGVVWMSWSIFGRVNRPEPFHGPVENTAEQEAELQKLVREGKKVEAARKLRIWHRGLSLQGAVDEVKRIQGEQGHA